MDPTFTPVSSHVFPRFFRWFFPGAAACGASASSDGALCSPGASPGRFARGLRYPVPRRTSGTANKQLVKNDLVNLLVNKMLMPIMFDHVSARVSELRGSWFFHMGYERESCWIMDTGESWWIIDGDIMPIFVIFRWPPADQLCGVDVTCCRRPRTAAGSLEIQLGHWLPRVQVEGLGCFSNISWEEPIFFISVLDSRQPFYTLRLVSKRIHFFTTLCKIADKPPKWEEKRR